MSKVELKPIVFIKLIDMFIVLGGTDNLYASFECGLTEYRI